MTQICPQCGAENRPTARFCHQCGSRLTQPEAASPAPIATAEERNLEPSTSTDDVPVATVEERSLEPLPPTLPGSQEMDSAAAPPADADGEDERAEPPELAGAPADAASAPDGEAQGEPAMLAIGAVLANRYHVVAAESAADGALEYVVEDRGVCRSCGVEVQASEEEPYCFECGAHLLDAATPWPRRRLRPATDDDASPSQLAWDGLIFEIIPEDTSSADMPAPPAPLAFHQGVTLQAGQRSDVGVARAGRPDEDSIFVLTVASIYESYARPTLGLYIVADGMGGHGDGEVASRITVDVISAALIPSLVMPLLQGSTLPEEAIRSLIDAALQSANRRVIDNARLRGNDMGSTVTLAFVVDQEAYIANVGDSRTYLWRGGMLSQITEDHSAVFQLVRQGILAEDEIYTHPRRNEIVRSVGFGSRLQVDHFRQQLLPGDALLLCCDGLWEMLHNDGVADVLLAAYGDPQAICDELIKRANLAGGDDNISVVVVRAAA